MLRAHSGVRCSKLGNYGGLIIRYPMYVMVFLKAVECFCKVGGGIMGNLFLIISTNSPE